MRLLAPCILALLSFAVPVHAAPEPIVFDFEDGLQGWSFRGFVSRTQTNALGGEWVLYGDGTRAAGAYISIEMDLTDVASISLEQAFRSGDEDGLTLFLGRTLIENIFIGTHKVMRTSSRYETAPDGTNTKSARSGDFGAERKDKQLRGIRW